MSIIIIDNFQVDISNPIDNRFVVGSQSITSGPSTVYPTPFYKYKEDIVYKYPGLRIWDFNDNVPYVWDGTQWINENTTGALVQDAATGNTGFQNYVTKFANNQTLLTASSIYDTLSNIGIGLTGIGVQPYTNTIAQQSNSIGLHVSGNIRSGGWLIGNINADYIVDGLLSLERITPPGTLPSSGVYILKNITGDDTGTSWDLVENIINTTSIVDDNTSPTNQYLTFVETVGHKQVKISTSKLQFNPNSGQLFLGNGTENNPAYSFINSTETGIYYDGYNINFSKQGHNFVSIVDHGISIKSTSWPQISFINTTTNSNKLLWVSGDDLLYRLDSSSVLTDKRLWHQDNLFTLKTLGDKNVETGRNLNISITNTGTNDLITGVYTYNVNSTISPSSHNFWSVLSFGKGDAGSIQLASNWNGNNSTPTGNVVADRDILIRSLNATDSWSPWVKVWNSGNSGYVPFGAIIMWSGTISQMPTGWRLCDGSSAVSIPAGSVPGQPSMTSITIPDLRERFIVGAGGDNPNVDTFTYDSFTFSPSSSGSFTITPSTLASGTFTINTSNTYYVSGITIYSGTTLNDSPNQYYVYQKTGTNPYYLIYNDNSGISNYILVSGIFPGNGGSITTAATNTSPSSQQYYIIKSEYKKSVTQYNRYVSTVWTKARRVDLPGIVWPNGFYSPGDVGGYNDVKLQVVQIATHAHTLGNIRTHNNNNTNHPLSFFDQGWDVASNTSTDPTGGNLSHENRPPYFALAFIIYTGI